MKNLRNIGMAAAVVIAAPALAGNTYDGGGGVLNDAEFDNNFNTVPGVTSFDIVIGDEGVIRDFSVDLNILHTWVGDLDVTISNGTTTVSLIDRPGVPDSTFGNSDDLVGLYSFVDGFAPIPEDADPGGSGIVALGTYGAAGSLADFNGSAIAGTWTLSITDNASGDSGEVLRWAIHADVNPVPAPGALAMLGLAGLAARARRRR